MYDLITPATDAIHWFITPAGGPPPFTWPTLVLAFYGALRGWR